MVAFQDDWELCFNNELKLVIAESQRKHGGWMHKVYDHLGAFEWKVSGFGWVGSTRTANKH